MAQIGGQGGDRDVNIEVNLVPFIDLMSVLITFLLITAVWSQVSMIQIGSSIYGKKNADETPPPPPELIDLPLRLDVKGFGFRLLMGRDAIRIPKATTGYNTTQLLAELKKFIANYPSKSDAVITVDDEIAYENLILGMDVLIQAGFPAVSVATGGTE